MNFLKFERWTLVGSQRFYKKYSVIVYSVLLLYSKSKRLDFSRLRYFLKKYSVEFSRLWHIFKKVRGFSLFGFTFILEKYSVSDTRFFNRLIEKLVGFSQPSTFWSTD